MLVTDAWEPQVNGVVRTLSNTMRELEAMGCEIEVVSPADYPNTVPLITYSEIRLALGAREDVEERFLAFAPDAVHIATEGTLGWDARHVCLKHKFPFTTSVSHAISGICDGAVLVDPAVGRLSLTCTLSMTARGA